MKLACPLELYRESMLKADSKINPRRTPTPGNYAPSSRFILHISDNRYVKWLLELINLVESIEERSVYSQTLPRQFSIRKISEICHSIDPSNISAQLPLHSFEIFRLDHCSFLVSNLCWSLPREHTLEVSQSRLLIT